MHRLPITLFTRAGRVAALGMLITMPTLMAQSSCTNQVTEMIAWLKATLPFTKRQLFAIVASNQNINGIVTYASIEMQVATALGIDYLTAKSAGNQYFSDITYDGTDYPFAPQGIKSEKLQVLTSGYVTATPTNGTVTHKFTASCDQGSLGVMRGFQPTTGILPAPYYTISWIRQEKLNFP